MLQSFSVEGSLQLRDHPFSDFTLKGVKPEMDEKWGLLINDVTFGWLNRPATPLPSLGADYEGRTIILVTFWLKPPPKRDIIYGLHPNGEVGSALSSKCCHIWMIHNEIRAVVRRVKKERNRNKSVLIWQNEIYSTADYVTPFFLYFKSNWTGFFSAVSQQLRQTDFQNLKELLGKIFGLW